MAQQKQKPRRSSARRSPNTASTPSPATRLTGDDLIEIGRLIDKAIEVRTARANALTPIDAEESTDRRYTSASVASVRAGVIADLQELRTIVLSRFEDLDQQLSAIRVRVNALESHVFGDGPNAVSGR